ncbi:uncharacterized protein [Nicotiana sylvestris]|uniref:uncharacterized protein n=1 Tax=Nicotiana sylvestris TaxID=4096 RepID=UPI00388C8A3C
MAQAFVKQFQYNIDIAPNCNSLSNMKKKLTKSFREYAIKWREQEARVKPPMDNHELITVFLEAQEPDYFQNMMSAMGRPFAEAIKIGEMVENSLKTGRIVSQAALKATTQAIQNGLGSFANRKKRDEGAPGHNADDCWTLKRAIERLITETLIVVTNGEDPPNVTINPLPAHNDVHFVGMIGRDQEHKPFDRAERTVGTIQEGTKRDVSLSRDVPLIVKGAPSSENVTLFVPKVMRLEVRSNVPSPRLYVLGGHPITRQNQGSTKGIIEPIIIRPTVQPPVTNTKTIPWNYNKTVMTYKSKEIIEEVGETEGLTRSGRCYSLEELRKVKQIKEGQLPIKKSVTEEETEEFLKKMKVHDYSIIDQLRKTPAQISLLSMFLHSKEHARVLIKTLNEAYVSENTTVNELEKMASRFFEVNRISFTDDELPEEGVGHNRALHLVVKCGGHYVKRVMVDGGSSVDVCPLSALQGIKINTDRIRPSNVRIQAFDGSVRDTIGEINLTMMIGPIIVHGEDESSIYKDPLIPCIEAKEGCESIIYKAFEVVSMDHVEEGKPILHPHLSATSVMVVALMLRQGYKPGKGLGASLQGISKPISPFSNKGAFGLGFRPTQADKNKAKHHKKYGWDLQQPISHIFYIFVKPRLQKGQNSLVQSNIDEIRHGLSQMFSKVNMIQAGKGTSRADVQLIVPDTMLNNWEATSFPTRKESWDVFAWSYNDMPGLSADLVVHKLPTYPDFPPIQQKQQKFKTDDQRLSVKPPILVPPEPGRPLFLYLSVMDNSFGCVLGQHDATGKKEHAIYYLSKKFNNYENPFDDEYMSLNTYFPDEEVNSIEEVVPDDHPIWKIYFDGAINIKGVGIRAILISPIGHHYPATARLRFFCTNNTAEYEACIMGLKMAIDLDMHELLVMGDSDLLIRQAQGEWETRDIKLIPYRQCVLDLSKRFKSIEFRYIPKFHNKLADALATLASMLPYPSNTHIDPLEIQVQNQHGYCNTIETEPDGEPYASNGHRFTLVAIDYFTKWVEAITFKVVTKKAVIDFVHSNIICHFGIPKTIITDNAANLKSHLMKGVCEQLKITHRHSTPYRPKANRAVEVANKNIKKILRKMIQGFRKWHEKLSFALLGYRTSVRTSVGATPYLLVYGTEAVTPAKVEIPSL